MPFSPDSLEITISLLSTMKDGIITLSGQPEESSSSSITLKHGIERAILDRVPEVAEVVDVTDHTSGANPFY